MPHGPPVGFLCLWPSTWTNRQTLAMVVQTPSHVGHKAEAPFGPPRYAHAPPRSARAWTCHQSPGRCAEGVWCRRPRRYILHVESLNTTVGSAMADLALVGVGLRDGSPECHPTPIVARTGSARCLLGQRGRVPVAPGDPATKAPPRPDGFQHSSTGHGSCCGDGCWDAGRLAPLRPSKSR